MRRDAAAQAGRLAPLTVAHAARKPSWERSRSGRVAPASRCPLAIRCRGRPQKLEDLPRSRAAVLSGGERRKLEITRALVLEPRFLCLDEPFAGTDPITVVEIQRTISYLKQLGIGVLIWDHNVARDSIDSRPCLHYPRRQDSGGHRQRRGDDRRRDLATRRRSACPRPSVLAVLFDASFRTSFLRLIAGAK